MRPLEGVRIADFTVHNAGPFCTHMLSQLGAECIKIESAQRPDIFRKPHAVYGRMGPATFDQVASNKLSVRLNLKHAEGVALAKRLVSISDVAAESFRPGVMTRLGLGYDVLHALKKEIVLLSVSSSGQTGPDAHFGGYAPLFGAWGGLGAMTGYEDGPPVEIRHVMDHSVGLNAAVAVVAALHRQRSTGEGMHVDIAAREVASSLLGEALLLAASGGTPQKDGNDHQLMAPHGVYPAAGDDKWISIAVRTDDQWRAFTQVIGSSNLLNDVRFARGSDRIKNRDSLNKIVAAWTKERSGDDAAEMLQAAGVPAQISCTAEDLVGDPHLRTRGAIVDVQEPDGKVRAAVGVPMRMSKGEEIGIVCGTPALGEHEDYVFGELLNLTRAERAALESSQAIY